MFLKKVHVKNFRGLQDVVLEFNQSLSPSVFPVGSLNGGGKSTLLQLIFILLRCAADPQKHHYIQNILKSNLSALTFEESEIIHFVINYQGEDIDLRFLTASCRLSDQDLDFFYQYEQSKKELDQEMGSNFDFNQITAKLNDVRKECTTLHEIIQSLNKMNIESAINESQRYKISRFIDSFQNLVNRYTWPIQVSSLKMFQVPRVIMQRGDNVSSMIEVLDELLENLRRIALDLDQALFKLIQQEQSLSEVREKLQQNGYTYLTVLSDQHLVFCQLSSSEPVLDAIAKQVYLACPLTQVLLFLEEKARMYLLNSSEGLLSYIEAASAAKKDIGNWYNYEFSPVKILAEVFQRCRDADTEVALSSGGNYGTSLMQIQKEVNQFFHDKTVLIENEFQTITFRKKDAHIPLMPEDLSHGELKKFGIYLWLKYTEIKDAIVLMDEVETNFHPDWQYSIVNELLEWSDNNQFILATHSHELCNAVTPAHVNEIEPRLNSKKQDSQEN